ncbi:radial spoke head protein 6 homolog A-like isoform X1 [Petromyzon marinus]|uniref:radial spoke head protein 6 homolog A-like isoform X1 n=2 Tax=Petromyzon marinus TaxID=7757 RepID=UPI003F70A7BF
MDAAEGAAGMAKRCVAEESAKAFLLKAGGDGAQTSLYDHLASLLSRLLDERPNGALDMFEELSREVKRSRMAGVATTFRDERTTNAQDELAKLQRGLFPAANDKTDDDPDDEMVESPLPNLLEQAFYWEQAGVGLGREETFRILLALKQLVDEQPLQRCRFWGKVLATQGAYLVAEVEFREGEGEDEEEEGEEADAENKEGGEETDRTSRGRGESTSGQSEGEGNGAVDDDDYPKSEYKPPPVTRREAMRFGANRYTYFVTNEPGKPWEKLPWVTPAQIVTARRIRRLFTGHLDAPVISYPPFPGNEANLLRAQIARISAGTQVSPLGFYQFEEDEEEGEEDAVGGRETCIENPDFEGIPVRELVDNLANWVHHTQHILPQGRCVWINPKQRSEDPEEEEQEEDEEDTEEPDEPEPEVGPPLLTPLSEDAEIEGTAPWTARLSSTAVPQHAFSVLRSNLWPGSYAYCKGKIFENLYMGWGVKYVAGGFSPALVPMPCSEYAGGPEVAEEKDPSVEEEQAYHDEEARRAAEKEDGEEEEEEEEDEPEEEDDD